MRLENVEATLLIVMWGSIVLAHLIIIAINYFEKEPFEWGFMVGFFFLNPVSVATVVLSAIMLYVHSCGG